mmetsp:Transcript_119560/g.371655  ORF Transcript_119560/g.371655 Transcript_119560/m.371655 type:complete len:80 (+) Transcript_119560:107-346(+)
MNMLGDAKKAMLEKTLSTTEETFKDKLPCYLKMFTPCNGGSAVETLHMFEFAVPADQKDSFNKAYQTYADAKQQLKDMK